MRHCLSHTRYADLETRGDSDAEYHLNEEETNGLEGY